MKLLGLGNLFVQKLLPKNTMIPLKYPIQRAWEIRLPHQPLNMTVAKDIYDVAGDTVVIPSGTTAKVIFPRREPETLPFPFFLACHPPVKHLAGYGSISTFDCKNVRVVVYEPEPEGHLLKNGDMVMLQIPKQKLSSLDRQELLEKVMMGPTATAQTVEDVVLEVFNPFQNGFPRTKP